MNRTNRLTEVEASHASVEPEVEQSELEREFAGTVRKWCDAVESMTVELNRGRDDLARAHRTLEATEQEAAEAAQRIAVLQGRPSRPMITWAALIGLTAGASAFLVLLALLTLTHVLGG